MGRVEQDRIGLSISVGLTAFRMLTITSICVRALGLCRLEAVRHRRRVPRRCIEGLLVLRIDVHSFGNDIHFSLMTVDGQTIFSSAIAEADHCENCNDDNECNHCDNDTNERGIELIRLSSTCI